MKRLRILISVATLTLSLFFICSVANGQSVVTQTFTLKPGWNAIFLEVQPDPRDPAKVFAGMEHLDSAWTWLSRESTAEFIQEPEEGLWGQPGWHAYFTAETEMFLTNLYAVLGNQAYLIKIKQTAPSEITWEVTGSPSLRKNRWLADSFNFVGFHLDPGNPPTFQDFFAPSPAHAGQAAYRLNNQSGKWEFVQNPATTKLRAGEAYWVYCEGASDFQGPLSLDLPMSNGLRYGAVSKVVTVTLSNLSEDTRTATFTSSGKVVLYYEGYDKESGYFTLYPLGQMPPQVIDSGRSLNVWLEVRREKMDLEPSLSESVLQILDDRGVRLRVPVSAERIQ